MEWNEGMYLAMQDIVNSQARQNVLEETAERGIIPQTCNSRPGRSRAAGIECLLSPSPSVTSRQPLLPSPSFCPSY